VKTAKEKAVEYTRKGGITNEQFVSLEDIQANNEYQHRCRAKKQVEKMNLNLLENVMKILTH
jgi:hypothetical protein